MTRERHTRDEARALYHECPHCGAAPGWWCYLDGYGPVKPSAEFLHTGRLALLAPKAPPATSDDSDDDDSDAAAGYITLHDLIEYIMQHSIPLTAALVLQLPGRENQRAAATMIGKTAHGASLALLLAKTAEPRAQTVA